MLVCILVNEKSKTSDDRPKIFIVIARFVAINCKGMTNDHQSVLQILQKQCKRRNKYHSSTHISEETTMRIKSKEFNFADWYILYDFPSLHCIEQ